MNSKGPLATPLARSVSENRGVGYKGTKMDVLPEEVSCTFYLSSDEDRGSAGYLLKVWLQESKLTDPEKRIIFGKEPWSMV